MKHYLAFKAVNTSFRSIFIKGILCREYAVGKTMRSHPKLPMFLVDYYGSNWDLLTGADNAVAHILLVRVPANHVVYGTPDVDLSNERLLHLGRKIKLQDVINKLSRANKCYHGATRLTVLEIVQRGQFSGANEAMKFYEGLYGIPRVPAKKS